MLFQTDNARKTWVDTFKGKMLLAVTSFSPKERMMLIIFVGIAVTSGLAILSSINHSFMTTIPMDGGSLTEGIVGTPRFINPVLAVSDADKDLTALTYSGLMRKGNDGQLIPDLASGYEQSSDGLTYTFTLKNHLLWNDGKPLTADDVIFTIEKIKDTTLRSPKQSTWAGVTVNKVNDMTVSFTLKQPYAPFIENTTVGIIPKHIWDGLSSDQWGFSSYNNNPVGTGPYKVSKIQQNASGIPEYYDLIPYADFVLGKPYIQNIRIKFYANDEALLSGYKAGEVESAPALSPEYATTLQSSGTRIERTPLPRIFSIFMNETVQPIFTDQSVREALDVSVDKNKIIQSILLGYATEALGPLPPGVMGSEGNIPNKAGVMDENSRMEKAKDILAKHGWTINPVTQVMEKITKKKPKQTLMFTLSTSDAPELKAIADLLKTEWSKIGAKVDVKVFESGDLNQNVIRPRKYDALLFGEIIGTDPDPYAFWHSSQRFDPGLNIALYANVSVDKLLEKARETPNWDDRKILYEQFQAEVDKDTPAIFLYSPDFIYALPKNIHGITLAGISAPADRFSNIYQWYAETQEVWKPFANMKR